MKKTGILLLLLLSLMLGACSSNAEDTADTTEALQTEEAANEATTETAAGTEEQTEPATEADEVPVTADDLVFDWYLTEPDINGMVNIRGTYENNSSYVISQIVYNLNVTEDGEPYESSMPSADTVMPGGTSPLLYAFGPTSQSEDDVEFTGFELVALAERKGWIITHDYASEQYEVSEFPRFPEPEPPVTVDAIPYEFIDTETDYVKAVMGLVYTNNTDFTIETFALTVLAKEENETYGFSLEENVAPGESSPEVQQIRLLPGTELEPRSIIFRIRGEDGEGFYVSYDYQTRDYRTTPLYD